jgi:hypothetical protein
MDGGDAEVEDQIVEAIEELGDQFDVEVLAGLVGGILDPAMSQPVGKVASDIGL